MTTIDREITRIAALHNLTAADLLSTVVERAEAIAHDRAMRVRAARLADRADLLDHAHRRPSILDHVESCDDLGCPTLAADAPDVCENV